MAGFGPCLYFFFCIVLGVRVSGGPRTFFFPRLITGLEKESQGSSLCIHYIYSSFQKEVAVPRFRWQFPSQITTRSAFTGRVEGAERRTCPESAQKNPPALHSPEVPLRDFKSGETTVSKCGE